MSESEAVVRVERRPDGVAIVTLARPHVLNAVSTQMARELTEAVHELEETATCVILTGDGDRAFGAGLDLTELRDGTVTQRAGQQQAMLTMQRTLAESRVPLVAAVNGLAMGASWQMVLHCDFVVAVDSAQFGMPEISAGQPCIIGSWLLSTVQPSSIVADIVLTSRRVSAGEARDLGLVSSVVGPGALLDAAGTLAGQLAARRSLAFDATRSWIRSLRYETSGGFERTLTHADTVLAQINRIPKEAPSS